MSTEFYAQLRELRRWLDRPGVIMNYELMEKLEAIQASLHPLAFRDMPGYEYLDMLIAEVSLPAPWPIDQRQVHELIGIVCDAPLRATGAASTLQEVAMSSPTTEKPAVLVAADRCDRCGAAAQLRAILPTGGELLFCGHHGREHTLKLAELKATVYDESGTERLAA